MARKKSRRKKRVSIALVLSVIAHACLVATLIYFTRRSSVTSRRGVISVELIENVRHDPVAPTFRNRPVKSGSNPSRADATPSARTVTPAQIGDPHAVAQATDSYIQSVLRIIHKHKTYPRESLEREEEGKVVLGVSVAADGKILDVRIEEPSPFQRLDSAALSTISSLSTFPPLPEILEAPLHLHIPLLFRLASR